MKRSVLLSSAILPVLLATGAMGQVVNFHDGNNEQFGYDAYISGAGNVYYAYTYDELYAGQGAYPDPGNNVWNGYGIYAGTWCWKYYTSTSYRGGSPMLPTFPQPAGNPGNPYAAYYGGTYSTQYQYSSYFWHVSNGSDLFQYGSTYASAANATSNGQVSPITLTPYYSYSYSTGAGDVGLGFNFAVPNATPSFLLGDSSFDFSSETFTLGNVPDGTYGLFLYGQSVNGVPAGTLFSLDVANGGNAHNGIAATLNSPSSLGTNTFIEGTNYVVFENVVPDGGNITITATPNPACGVGNTNTAGVVYVNGLQLIFNPPPTALGATAAQNVYAGGTAKFSFTPAFVSPNTPAYSWQSIKSGVTNTLSNVTLGDGAVISGATSTNLVISNVTSSEVGLYQCVITAGTNTGVSPAAPLTLLVNNATGALQNGAPASSGGYLLHPGDVLTDFYGTVTNPQPFVGANGVAGPPLFGGYTNGPQFGGLANSPYNVVPAPFCMTVSKVVDNTLSQYVNLGSNGGAAPFLGPVGFIVTPQVGSTIATGMRFFAANSHPESDPADYRLEGSTNGGSSYTFIAGGALALPAQRNVGGAPINITNQVLQEITFANSAAYTTYRLTFTNVNNDAASSNGLQIAEVQLLGSFALVAPGIAQQPSPTSTIMVGGTLHASIVANGVGPFGYKWYKTSALSGQTNATLAYSVTATGNAGSYYCVVTNPYGSTTSSPVVLSVVSPANPSYQKTLMTFSPLAYWPLNEGSGPVALDYAGGYNGTYVNVSDFGWGSLPYPGFASYNSSPYFDPENPGYVDVPGGPFNITNAVTIVGWVATDAGGFMDILGHGDASYRITMYSGSPAFNDNNLVDDASDPATISDSNWHMVAGVYAGGNGSTNNGLLYVDGLLVASNRITSVAGNSLDLWIGGAPDYGSARLFGGDLGQAAVIPSALSATQIQQLYGSAGVPPSITVPSTVTVDLGGSTSITATVSGSQPFTNKWYYVSNSVSYPISGATNLTLSLNNIQAGWGTGGFYYYLVVSNAYNNTGATSGPVSLNILSGAPGIQTDISPLWSELPVGASQTFSVTATNTEPFTNQWYTNATKVSGATNSSYTFTVLAGTNTCNVVVSNSVGHVSSSTATVVGYIAPPVAGFNTDGNNWTLNNGTNFTPTIANNVLTLTDGLTAEATSAFYNIPQYIGGGFIASFVYQVAGTAPYADGITFCLQNSSAGSNAVGYPGGDLGYTGIANSIAFEMNLWLGANGGVGIQFGTGGSTPDSAENTPVVAATAPYSSASPVAINSGDPIYVQLYYNPNVLTVWLVDETTGSKFTTNYAVTNLAAIVGGQDVYVGFTGGSGFSAVQTVSNFVFSANSTTLPSLTVARGSSAGTVVVSWPAATTTLFQLQQATSPKGPWSNVVGTPTLVGSTNQITLTPGVKAIFYKLVLP